MDEPQPVIGQPDGRLLSKEEAVAYLGGDPITVRTIDGLVRRREIGFLKIGRAVVFPRSALETYVREHTVKPEPTPWGLTPTALSRVRSDRAAPRRRAS